MNYLSMIFAMRDMGARGGGGLGGGGEGVGG